MFRLLRPLFLLTFTFFSVSLSGQNWETLLTAGGSSGNEVYSDMHIDNHGNVYLTGAFSGSTTFDNVLLTSNGATDFFIVKYDSSGNLIYATSGGGSSGDLSNAIVSDNNGNAYITGLFSPGGMTIAGTTLIVNGQTDIFTAKIDTLGNFVWAKKSGGIFDFYGSLYRDRGLDIAYDNSNGIYITGVSSGQGMTFGPFLHGVNQGDATDFIGKYDLNGNEQWIESASSVGGGFNAPFSLATCITYNSISNSLIVGGYNNILITIGGGGITRDNDLFFRQIFPNGSFGWYRSYGGTAQEEPADLSVDGAGNIYAVGSFNGDLEIPLGNVISTSINDGQDSELTDAFILKLNQNATAVNYVKTVSGSQDVEGLGIVSSQNGNVYVSGKYKGTPGVDNVALNPKGEFDIFLLRIDSAGSLNWIAEAGGAGDDEGVNVELLDDDKIILSGGFSAVSQFGGFTRTSLGFSDAFLAQLDCKPERPPLIAFDSVVCIGDTSDFVIPSKFGVNYTWSLSSGGSIDTSQNSASIIWNVVGNHTLTISPNNVCGTGQARQYTVRVRSEPSAPLLLGDSSICLGLGTYFISNPMDSSYTWSLSGGGSLVQLNNQALVSWSNPGQYIIGVSGINECGIGDTSLVNVSVAQFPSGPTLISGNTTTCTGVDTFLVNTLPETNYSWNLNGGGILQDFDSFAVVSWTNSGTYILSVTPSNICGTASPSSQIINVSDVPSSVEISGDSSACLGSSSFSVSEINGATYNWQVSGGGTLLNLGNTAIVNWTTAGDYIITASVQNNCGISTIDTFLVSVKSSAIQPGVISGNISVCIGSEPYSVAQQTGQNYTWTLSSGGTLSFVDNLASVDWNQVGFHTLSVTTNNECGQGLSRDLVVEVKDVPDQPGVIFGNDEVCLGLENYNVFSQSGINYNWTLSGGGQIFPSGNSVSVNWTVPGNYDLIVTPSNQCGNGVSRVLSIESKDVPQPITGISGIDTVCLGSQIYTIDSPETGSDINYNWSLSGGGLIAPNGNSATISWTTPGTYTLTVQAQNTCGFGTPVSRFITVRNTAEQFSTISGDDIVCLDTNIYQVPLIGGFSYNWSLTGGGQLNAINNQAEIIWQTTGNYNLSVTTTDGCTKTLPIEVKDLPSQPSAIGGDTVVCFGSKSYAVNPIDGQTYNWSLSGGGNISGFGNAAITNWNATGVYDVQVSASNLCGTGPQQNLEVTVLTIPQAPIFTTGDSLLCKNQIEDYSVSANDFESYSWSLNRGGLISPNDSIASITWLDTGDALLSVNATNLCGTGSNSILNIRINDTPALPQITGADKVCLDSQLYTTTFNSDLNYNWSLATGGILNDSLNLAQITWQDTGTYVIDLFLDNNCGNSDTQSFEVQVFDIPTQPQLILGDSITCLGLSSYEVLQKPEESYTWSLSGGGILNPLNNSATINWTSTGIHQIFVQANNLCGTGPVDTFEVEVRSIPTQPSSIAGDVNVCLDSRLYSVSPQNNVIYNWSLNGNGNLISGDSSSALVNWTSTGLAGISVSASNLCGTSPTQSLSINISDIPGPPSFISGDTLTCLGNEIYTVASGSGLTYNWSVNGGGSVSPNANQANINWNQTGNWAIITSLTNLCGTGPEDTLAVRIKTIPDTVQYINPDTIVCLGNTVYEVSNLPETNYSWSLNGGGSFSFVNNRSFVTWTTPGAYLLSVSPSNICGSGQTSTLQVDVNSVPDPPVFSSPDTLSCIGPEVYEVIQQTGADYLWSLSGGGGASSNGNQYNVNWATTGNFQIDVSAFNFCGTSSSVSLSVLVDDIPSVPQIVSADSSVCIESTSYRVIPISNLTYNWNLNGGGFLNPAGDSALVNWLVPGNYNLTVNAENFCGVSQNLFIPVEVNDIPSQPVNLIGAVSACNGEAKIYEVDQIAGLSYSWTLDGLNVGSDSASAEVVFTEKGIRTLDVRASNQCGQGPNAEFLINVRDVPEFQGAILGDEKICKDNLASYEVSAQDGLLYFWSLEGPNEINAQENQVLVDWSVPGSYDLSLTAANSCGTSLPLVKQIIVDDDPEKPEIFIREDSIKSSSLVDNVWYLNGEIIEDSGIDFIIPTSSGRYTLQVINTCSESPVSDFISFYAGDNLESEIYLIPNPAVENVRIQLPLNVSLQKIEIVDSRGRIQEIINTPELNNQVLNINSLSPGFYLISMETSIGQTVHKKLVVK